MARVVILGIDSLDRELLARYEHDLPNIGRIMDASRDMTSTSVFPPDSDTAWATIYTGMDPSHHGVVEFVDPLERSKLVKQQQEYVDRDVLEGRTFWDVASAAGKRVCLVNPHLAFPVWRVNGFMCHLHPSTDELTYLPGDYTFGFDVPRFRTQKRIPRSRLEFQRYLEEKEAVVREEFEFFSKMYREEAWDLYFFYSSGLDAIMHLFWSYCDPEDPTHPGPNPFDDAIREFHVLYDKLIGLFLEHVPDDTKVILVSDHGHAMRPVNVFNVNEALRRAGFLRGKTGAAAPIHNAKERLKRWAVDIAQWAGLRAAAMTVVRAFPGIKKAYTSPSNIDFTRTVAHCTDLSGMKAYTYGGVLIRRENLSDPREYERVRGGIIDVLRGSRLPGSEESVFEWVCPREELYDGPHLSKYPDVVFNLKEGFGAGWSINGDLYARSLAHKFYPGSHRARTPVFHVMGGGSLPALRSDVAFTDIAPTILDLLGVPYERERFQGRSLLGAGGR